MTTRALSDVTAPSVDSLADLTGFRLRRLHGHFQAHWARWFRQRGVAVTPVQGGILLLIDENPGLPQVALARLLRIEAPTLQQTLNPLVEAGLVERYRSPKDRRAIALHLSRSGRDVMKAVRAEMAAQEADLLAGLSAAERVTLNRLLDKALAVADAAMDDT